FTRNRYFVVPRTMQFCPRNLRPHCSKAVPSLALGIDKRASSSLAGARDGKRTSRSLARARMTNRGLTERRATVPAEIEIGRRLFGAAPAVDAASARGVSLQRSQQDRRALAIVCAGKPYLRVGDIRRNGADDR